MGKKAIFSSTEVLLSIKLTNSFCMSCDVCFRVGLAEDYSFNAESRRICSIWFYCEVSFATHFEEVVLIASCLFRVEVDVVREHKGDDPASVLFDLE